MQKKLTEFFNFTTSHDKQTDSNFLEIEMLNPRSKDSCYVSIVDNDKKVLQTVSNAACY